MIMFTFRRWERYSLYINLFGLGFVSAYALNSVVGLLAQTVNQEAVNAEFRGMFSLINYRMDRNDRYQDAIIIGLISIFFSQLAQLVSQYKRRQTRSGRE
jgi:hypothetical protein